MELENSKIENKGRKLEKKTKETEEERRKKEENKLEFLRKYYPNSILAHPSESKNRLRREELSFSPHPKRKTGGGEHIGKHKLSSPSKKLKFTEKLSFWKY